MMIHLSTYCTKKSIILFFVILMFNLAFTKSKVKPNIIYILADDLGFGDLGCYGQKIIQTPNIDKLCKEGMKFTNHHSGSTVCAPSRACLLTGLHTGHVSVKGNGNVKLKPDNQEITIARLLKNIGYHTAMIGKNGLGCNGINPGFANKKGFDHFYGFNSHEAAHYYYPPFVFRNGDKVVFPNNKLHHGDTYIHDEFMKEIMTYLDDRSKEKKPFFLHYAALIPHASLVVPDEWVEKYRGKVEEHEPLVSPKRASHYTKCNEPVATFAGMVSRLDWEIGQIMKKLDDLGIAENTLVIFSSDNGPHQEGGKDASWLESSGGLRGHKRDLYEGGVRVPMIAHWPGHIQAASESNHLSAFWDVMPTLCELTGAVPPSNIDGISFLPTLLGLEKQKQHEYLYWFYKNNGGKRAVLTHKWKAVKLAGKPTMLFSVTDLYETKNLASENLETVKELEELFKRASAPIISN